MKYLALILIAVLAFAVLGCSKKLTVATEKEEQILAVVGAGERLFVIDTQSEYEFDKAALDKFYFLKDFLSDYNGFIKDARIFLSVNHTLNPSKTRIFFSLLLDGAKLKNSDVKAPESSSKYYKFEPKTDGSILITFSEESGKVVKLKEREQILRDFAAARPLIAQKLVLSNKSGFKSEVATTLAEMSAPIIFPFWLTYGLLRGDDEDKNRR